MNDTITLNGRTYTVRTEPDYDAGYPWENEDGHGPVIRETSPHWHREGNKRPGWRPLNRPDRNEYQFYYDWQAACKRAGRGCQRAAQADFDHLRRFIAGDWNYIGVIVEDAETGERESLWRVESDGGYPDEIAQELAEELDARLLRDEQSRTFPVSIMGV